MSTLTKVILGVALALAVLLGFQSYLYKVQSQKLAQQNLQMKQLNDNIEVANKAAKTQAVVAQVTDEAVTSATTRIMKNTERGEAIKAVVDNVTKKVANEKLSSTVASAAYANSMWDAYCTADPSDSACSTRQSTNKLSNR
jgi:Flp pilus assembly protein TadB